MSDALACDHCRKVTGSAVHYTTIVLGDGTTVDATLHEDCIDDFIDQRNAGITYDPQKYNAALEGLLLHGSKKHKN